ncbi:DUF7344 domain-containing protein [Haladaptatus caseinilyticus]|uniref:DUF7344 domain-containing protein n=1 Tax=Haladaptatus caseinilyticus TaxID=2993314 RepID=UPI00224AED54|nr:hypothetical protein [Haladaptatus caseinilyticus]
MMSQTNDRNFGEVTSNQERPYDLFGHPYRRTILALLDDREMPVSMSELVDELIVAEYGGEITARDKENVEISLYHVHLPKLADFGVINFDYEHGHVTEKAGFDDGEAWPDWIDSEELVSESR